MLRGYEGELYAYEERKNNLFVESSGIMIFIVIIVINILIITEGGAQQ